MRIRIFLLGMLGCYASMHAMTDNPAEAPKPADAAQVSVAPQAPATPAPAAPVVQPAPQEQPVELTPQPVLEAQPIPAPAEPSIQIQPVTEPEQPQPVQEQPQQAPVPEIKPAEAEPKKEETVLQPASAPAVEQVEKKQGGRPRLQAVKTKIEQTNAAPSKKQSAESIVENPEPEKPKLAPKAKPTSIMPKLKKKAGSEEQAEQAAQERINIGEGISTIDVESGGNWLRKRIIWEDAQAKYEKIKAILAKILESRMDFFAHRSAVDRDLNLFFVDIGFAQGELEETVQDLLDSIEADRKKTQGMLDPQERDIREQLLNRKNEIEQLKADAKSIGELDNALDEALTQLLKQINLAASYESQAWKRFKDIGQELNDKKAKEHYAHIEAFEKSVQDIYQYINGPLLQYSEGLISKIREYMGSVKNRLEDIKNSGIELKKKLTEAEQAAQAKQVEQEQPKPQPKKPKAWYDSISFIWQYPLSFINKIWDWVFSWFGSKK